MSTRVPIGLQLYSVRQECEKDLLGTIAKVGAMGYEGVEFAGYFGHSAADIKKALDDAGLKCAGAHVGMHLMTPENFDATVEFHKGIGCEFLVIPWIPDEKRNSEAACAELGKELTELVAKIEAVGLRTGFHAHDGDMKPLDNGKTAWTMIGENTPASFIMQYDTGNGMHGGADPVAPILEFPGRATTVHLKEYQNGFGPVVGAGDVPWAKVFEACETQGGTQWYIVEHELESDPLGSVEECLANLKKMGK